MTTRSGFVEGFSSQGCKYTPAADKLDAGLVLLAACRKSGLQVLCQQDSRGKSARWEVNKGPRFHFYLKVYLKVMRTDLWVLMNVLP